MASSSDAALADKIACARELLEIALARGDGEVTMERVFRILKRVEVKLRARAAHQESESALTVLEPVKTDQPAEDESEGREASHQQPVN